MDKLTYLHTHRKTYERFLDQLAVSPVSAERRAEFAILSANCPFDMAKRAWYAVDGVSGYGNLARALKLAGYGTYNQRARYIDELREQDWFPARPYRVERRRDRPKGLGLSKYSFAVSLIDPWGTDVVCIDTHMYQHYTGEIPERGWYASAQRYEELEDRVLREADEMQMAPFMYQWMVWDWQRGQVEEHEFLMEVHHE